MDHYADSGRLAKITVKWPVVFRVASRLVEGHSMTTGTRSLDFLHIDSDFIPAGRRT
jgi:hypothetical protein